MGGDEGLPADGKREKSNGSLVVRETAALYTQGLPFDCSPLRHLPSTPFPAWAIRP